MEIKSNADSYIEGHADGKHDGLIIGVLTTLGFALPIIVSLTYQLLK